MATQQAEAVMVNDITVCSICFEKFKIPRYLPCKHSFCHDCLCSYIVSQCKSKEPRLEFHCPVCRQYIPGDGVDNKPEDWVSLFPVNETLQTIVAQTSKNQCELCLKNNEKATTANYCWTCTMSLCELCTKWHLKFPALNDHKIAPFTEIDHTRSTPIFGVSNHCPKHQNEQVQLYCSQHEQPCCGLCGATEHKKCKNVELITTAAQSLKKSGKFNSLIEEAKAFKEKLFLANSNLKNNISEIESQMDEKKSRFESEFRCMMQHLEKLKNDFLEEMSFTLKEGKDKLQGEIERIENGILCTNSCINGLEMAMNAANEREMVVKLSTSADTFRKLKKSHLKETNMKCEMVKTVGFKQIPDMQRIAFVNLDESASLIEFEVEKISLSVFKQFSIEKGKISSGFVLSSGNFLAVNETKGTCLMYDEEWNHRSVINNLVQPQDITQNEEGIFVTIPVLNKIELFSSRHFQHIRNIPMSDPRKITSFEGNVFVSSSRSIMNIDNTWTVKKIHETDFDISGISVTRKGLILLSLKMYNSKIMAITSKGETTWEYQSSNLEEPRGLHVDSRDQIYVSDRKSNNIHVLTNGGKLIRVIANIPNPMFFKVNEMRGVVCVGSGQEKIIVYKF